MRKFVLATAVLLSACSATNVKEVGDKVTVQSSFSSVDPIAADEAHRLCAKQGGFAKFESTREIQTPAYLPNKYQHLFRCVPGRRKPVTGGYLNSSRTL